MSRFCSNTKNMSCDTQDGRMGAVRAHLFLVAAVLKPPVLLPPSARLASLEQLSGDLPQDLALDKPLPLHIQVIQT